MLALKLVILAPKAPSEKFRGLSAKNVCHEVIPKEEPLEKYGNPPWHATD